MLTDEARTLLEAGSALIVGLTRPDGSPHATRAYGMDFNEAGDGAQLLLSSVDASAYGLQPGDAPDAPISVTCGDIRTLTSFQVKGTLLTVEASTEADQARTDAYMEEFTAAIVESDGVDPEVARRWWPPTVVRCQLTIDEVFLQTPGPGAGQPLKADA